MRLNCGSVDHGEIQPKLITFALKKPPSFQSVCEPELNNFEKTNKPNLAMMKVYSEIKSNGNNDSNSETRNLILYL